MGNFSNKASKKLRSDNDPLTLHDFHILRSVGRGAFGKVCIIQKKDTKHLFGLKYMSKRTIIERSASRNVLKELEILKILHHPFLVNLCYSFQDDEDMYIVLDLMLGGDIRFHLSQGHLFTEEEILLYVIEMGLVLEYLRAKRIIHRDVKPDNLLLDSKGHIHLTDFNIATWVPDGKVAVSLSGTRPYMAPEVYATSVGKHVGYSFEADWWSWGVTLCEMIRGTRPFSIHHDMSIESILNVFADENSVHFFPATLSPSAYKLITDLLQSNVKKRLCTVEMLKNYSALRNYDIPSVKKKLVSAKFTPSKDRLNCDPTHELEEMMIESNPLHKKKRKRRPKCAPVTDVKDPVQVSMENLTNKFTSFRRGSEDTTDPSYKMSDEAIEILSGRKCTSKQCSPRLVSAQPSPREKSNYSVPQKKILEHCPVPQPNNHRLFVEKNQSVNCVDTNGHTPLPLINGRVSSPVK